MQPLSPALAPAQFSTPNGGVDFNKRLIADRPCFIYLQHSCCRVKRCRNDHDLAVLAAGSTGDNRHDLVSNGIAKLAAGPQMAFKMAWVASATAWMAPATALHRGWATWGLRALRGRLLQGVAVVVAAEAAVSTGGATVAAVEAVLLARRFRDRGSGLAIWQGRTWRSLRQRRRRGGKWGLGLSLWTGLAATEGSQVARFFCQGLFQFPGRVRGTMHACGQV